MTSADLLLNPLTVADIVRDEGEPVALNLRCYAFRRSFKPLRVDRASRPELFEILVDWVEGKRPSEAPELDQADKLRLWQQGVLISPQEQAAVPPGMRPDLDGGHRLATELCPAAGDLLRHGPALPPTPTAPDADFAAAGYCVVPPVLGEADLDAMNAFYDALRDGGWMQSSDQGSKRRVIHNDPVGRSVHHALTPTIAALTGRDVKPSYSFASEYYESSCLPAHTDRDQCEFTLSLYLDYQPRPASDLCPWPLVVHTPEGEVAVHQRLGGGLLISGRVLPHSRGALPPGHVARMIFLHYVLASFDGPLD